MLSLNVPVPGQVRATVDRLRPHLNDDRRDYTLVCKRVGAPPATAERKRVRRALEGWGPFEVRITGLATFDRPASGEGAVLYLAVESRPLEALHDRLCEVVDPVSDIEGAGYVPHVTVGRTTDPDRREAVLARSVEPVTWTVEALEFWDARHAETAGRISLPA